MNDNELKKQIIEEASRIEECCEYSAKAHYNTSKEWNIGNLCLNIPIAIIAAVVVFIPDEYKTIPAVITAILAAVQACIKPTDCLKVHKMAGDKYLELKNKTRRFKNIEIELLTSEEAIKGLDKLASILDGYNSVNPQPSRTGYEKARKGIQEGEAQYKVDKEIK